LISKRVHLVIHGKVQGVFYRGMTEKTARSLGLAGWVRNLSDGTVEAVAEGSEEPLKRLVEWAWQGPTAAKVESIDETWSAATGEFSNFSILS
jgi:acylphosphatase